MKAFLSGVDLFCIVKELSLIKGSKVKKIYHVNDELLIHLYHPELGSPVLRIIPGRLIHLTSFKKESPVFPSNFCMYLRKYLLNASIVSVKQAGFERVVELVMQKESTYRLIIELFGKGNVVVADDDYKIMQCLHVERYASRVVKPHSVYSYPPKGFDLSDADFIQFKAVIKRSDKPDLVRALAVSAGLGGAYAEELCQRAVVDKGQDPKTVSEPDLRKVYDALSLILRKIKYLEFEPVVVIKNKQVYDVVPLKFSIYERFAQKKFPTFNEAVDYFYVTSEREVFEQQKAKALADQQERLSSQIKIQEGHLVEIREEAESLRVKASLIKDNLYLINKVFDSLLNARDEGLSWHEINDFIKQEQEAGSSEALLIKELRLADKVVVLGLGDGLELSLESKPSDLMTELFDRAKKLESKMPGAEQMIIELRQKLDSLTVEQVSFEKNVPKPINYKVSAWFDNYRWFNSSEGFLVVAGTDSGQNDELFNKHLDNDDLVFHADVAGAALVVVKNGRQAGEKTINEAALFAACHSKAWVTGLSVDVYYALPYQFTKSSDVLLARGSFIVKGRKNYVRGLVPSITLGIELINELTYRLISGPLSAVKAKCKHYVAVGPGNQSVNDVSREVREFFKIHGYSISVDEVRKAMPSGSLRIERKV